MRQMEVSETESGRPMNGQVEMSEQFLGNIYLRQGTDISHSLFRMVTELALRIFTRGC